MGRSIRSNNSLVLGNLITGDITSGDVTTGSLTATGLLSPQAGSENILGYNIITSATTLPDSDGSYLIISTSSFDITLPATTTDGRFIQIVDGGDFSSVSMSLLRNGNTINGSADDLSLDQSTSFFLIYRDGNWITKFYR